MEPHAQKTLPVLGSLTSWRVLHGCDGCERKGTRGARRLHIHTDTQHDTHDRQHGTRHPHDTRAPRVSRRLRLSRFVARHCTRAWDSTPLNMKAHTPCVAIHDSQQYSALRSCALWGCAVAHSTQDARRPPSQSPTHSCVGAPSTVRVRAYPAKCAPRALPHTSRLELVHRDPPLLRVEVNNMPKGALRLGRRVACMQCGLGGGAA